MASNFATPPGPKVEVNFAHCSTMDIDIEVEPTAYISLSLSGALPHDLHNINIVRNYFNSVLAAACTLQLDSVTAQLEALKIGEFKPIKDTLILTTSLNITKSASWIVREFKQKFKYFGFKLYIRHMPEDIIFINLRDSIKDYGFVLPDKDCVVSSRLEQKVNGLFPLVSLENLNLGLN